MSLRSACIHGLGAMGLVIFASTAAHAGSATRIQVVVEIPATSLTVLDASGKIAGEVDGIATDALAGSSPGEIIPGASLHLSLAGVSEPTTWGHLDAGGHFVPGLPASGRDGSFSNPSPASAFTKLYFPPVEFDIDAPSNATERPLTLAVEIEMPFGDAVVLKKPLVLVKPPLVLVHGINQNAASWVDWEPEFRNNRGFKTFAADHSGGSYDSGAPTWGGNGDVHDSYAFVRGGMMGSVGVAEALGSFRTGAATAHAGLSIAVEKADIVASSYGGILARWYVEQAPDYDEDVRKLITMGSPHRGVTAVNMNIQAVFDPVIANASSQLLSPVDTVAGTLQLIDDFGFLRWKKGTEPEDVVPSLQVLTFGSEVLGQLNTVPFRDDVAYASIVGTDDQLNFFGFFTINIFYDLDPVVSVLGQQKSYFPWMPILDAGANDSDAVVPTWSATLPARSATVPFDHLSFHDSTTVHDIVSIWLQDATLPQGAAHRSAFQGQVIDQLTSRENAYVGSTLVGTESVGGRLVDDAIAQVKFSGPTLSEVGGIATLDSSGGIVTATMTGMVRVDVAGTPQQETVTLDVDGFFGDTPLHVVTETLDPGTTPEGELFTFSLEATLGRAQSSILGPDGSASGTGVWSIGYDIADSPDYTQAPWTDIDAPGYTLPTPYVPGESEPFIVGDAPGSAFTVEGGVHATSAGAGTQAVNALLYEDNFFGDTVLEDRTFNVSMPADTLSGALMPYTQPDFFLFKNASGHVEGNDNSSFETNATVYHYLVQPGASNPSSANVSVNVEP